MDTEGVWVSYCQAKLKGEKKENGFLVPYDRNRPLLCFAPHVVDYLQQLQKSFPNITANDSLFHKALKSGYSRQIREDTR